MADAKDVHSQELYQMAFAHFNEPFLSWGELSRVIGYGETAIDCYIIEMKRGGEVQWHTCVGGYTFLDRLKEQNAVDATNGERWDDLTRLDNELKCSGSPKQEEFRLDLRHDDEERQEHNHVNN